MVMITKRDVFVQGELVTIDRRHPQRQDALVEPLRDALKRPLLVGKEMTERDLANREITIMADKVAAVRRVEARDGHLHRCGLRPDLPGGHPEGEAGGRRLQARLSTMQLAPYYREFELPWEGDEEASARFRKILRVMLILLVMFSDPVPVAAAPQGAHRR